MLAKTGDLLNRGKYPTLNSTDTLTLLFPFQLFHVAYILIKFANSPRPDLWVLERSVDHGRTFTPWQYFARESRCIMWDVGLTTYNSMAARKLQIVKQ